MEELNKASWPSLDDTLDEYVKSVLSKMQESGVLEWGERITLGVGEDSEGILELTITSAFFTADEYAAIEASESGVMH